MRLEDAKMREQALRINLLEAELQAKSNER